MKEMHESVMKFGEDNLNREEIKDKIVLEVGSRNVNGSLREYVESLEPKVYEGIDVAEGKGVDRIMDVRHLIRFYVPNNFDVIICTEMLEHEHDWKKAVYNMKSALKIGGILLLTVRGPGFPYHNPPDAWRFTLDNIKEIFSDFEILRIEEDPQVSGVLLKARKLDQPCVSLKRIEVAEVERD